MTVEQAVIYIMKIATDEQKQWASDVLIGKASIKKSLDNEIQYAKPNKKFELKTFDLGKNPTPTREEIYDERNLQILGLTD